MKIAVSGKGGVGKTTFAAFLIRALADKGNRVLAIDADPDANLAQALGVKDSDNITPISEMKELIEERTGAKVGSMGSFFRLNPKVDDLPETLSVESDGVRVMVMGGVKKGGAGCVCPESVLLKHLIMHIVLARDEVVVLDMEAGLEHLGRGTAMAVDRLIVVVEPGRRSIETAYQIRNLADDIGLKNLSFVGNKIRSNRDKDFLIEKMPGFDFLGFIPHLTDIMDADLEGRPPYETATSVLEIVKKMLGSLED
ncbi:MAG: carbon monoxide dehydrogenase accessory protein CooC [Desulfatiglans sp.]|jgi:CO dehydrogenase maturation factor|nr:carbon monoxide dehydrogenase accessory protein CooC [Thermodesulfobacteriota bacterium]MEE4351405.1 carbon monoxide dehydrogenase accessory protein CooC [Desulfatiglans sp.]